MDNKEERLKRRAELQAEGVRFQDDNFLEHFEKFLDTYTSEELLEELKECGLELTSEEAKHWLEPIVIDTEEDLNALLDAMERAAAFEHKPIDVNYKTITDINEIKRIFNNLKED